MHLSECIAEGGFKIINGPPINGKGPVSNEEDKKSSNEASPPKPTQAGRIETCQEMIEKAKKCLENNDKECVMRMIEELVKADCHDGRLIGSEIANSVKNAFHKLWLVSGDKARCRLLSLLKDLGVSKRWIKTALNDPKGLRRISERCGIKIERRVAKNKIIEEIEDLMKKELGWTEESMCRNLLQFIGIDINEFERYGVNICGWLRAETSISYLVGMIASDIADRVVKAENNEYVKVSLKTTEAISAAIFPSILSGFGKPGVTFVWDNGTPRQRKRTSIAIEYYIYVRKEEWKWLNIEELIKYIRALRPEDVPKLIAGIIDGDGTIYYNIEDSTPHILITACRSCGKKSSFRCRSGSIKEIRDREQNP